MISLALVTALVMEKPPEAVVWKKLPIDALICTRFGPPWRRDKGPYPSVLKGRRTEEPFTVSFPGGHELKLTVAAKGPAKQNITYSTTGWPPDAQFDPAKGTLRWTVPAYVKAFEVSFGATVPSGAAATPWKMVITPPTPAELVAWDAGLGGKAWPDCDARPENMELTERDLDGDGHGDVVVSTEWTEGGDPHEHRFSRHQIALRGAAGKRARRIDWPPAALEGLLGSLAFEKAPDGTVLLVVTEHACDGGEPVTVYRVSKGAVVEAGAFEPDHSEDPSGNVDEDPDFDVKAERAPDGSVGAYQVTSRGKTRRYAWRRGAFR